MQTGMLETRTAIETPEGVELLLTPAGPGARVLAYLFDWMIRLVALIILSIFLSYLDVVGEGLYFLAFFLLEWFYPVVFETMRHGATPGKRVMKLRVLHDNGTPVTFAGAMLRNLLRVADFLPFFYAAGVITMLCNRKFQRLGDLAAGTMVVYEFARAPKPNLQVAGTLVPPVPLSLEEQRAIVGFAERANLLSQGRQVELANLLAPVLKTEGEGSVEAIHRIANGLVGKT